MEKSLVLSTGGINLPKVEQEIYNASKGELIKNLEDDSVLNLASKVMSLAKFKLGTKDVNASEEQAQILMLVDDIKEMQVLTQAEILNGLKKGLNGEYLNQGENVVFFSSSNFVRWIKKYQQDKNEVMRKITMAKKEEPVKPVPSDSELKKMAINQINFYADKLKEAKDNDKKFNWIAGGLHELYKMLIRFDIQTISKEEMLEIWRKTENIKDEEERKNHCRMQSYILLANQLADFEARIDIDGKIKPIE
jgi:hypothetical protein